MGDAIAGCESHILLLGVTPEFGDFGRRLTAIDLNLTMVRRIWPGDDERRQALVADWRRLPFGPGGFTAAISDGALGSLVYPDGYGVLFQELARVLAPGGRVASRLYLSSRPGEAFGEIERDASRGNFSTLKWRLALAIAAARDDPNVPVRAIGEAFDRAFPDRAMLARMTGWRREEIDTIDDYAGNEAAISFPTPAQILAVIPSQFAAPRLVPVGSYPLAEHCPLLVMERRP